MSRAITIVAPVPGLVSAICVQVGDEVSDGDQVVTLQSMKTEIPLSAESAGIVAEILVKEGQEVELGAVLVRVTSR
jgi:3-methylcrotonyl-CoA carboxylase alpha subunit